MRISCVELHRDTIIDMLNPGNSAKLQTENFIPEEPVVSSIHAVREALNIARDGRATASTKLNANSSRSHCIYQLRVSADKAGVLTMIDLAGSENCK